MHMLSQLVASLHGDLATGRCAPAHAWSTGVDISLNQLTPGAACMQVTTCLTCGGINARGGTERQAREKKRRRRGGSRGRKQAVRDAGEGIGASFGVGVGVVVVDCTVFVFWCHVFGP